MKDREPKVTPPAKETKEQERLLTLSEKAQRAIFNNVLMSLGIHAVHEAQGDYKNNPERLEETEELRKITSAIAGNLGIHVDARYALTIDLTNLILREQLEKFTQRETVPAEARYFLNKGATRQALQNP